AGGAGLLRAVVGVQPARRGGGARRMTPFPLRATLALAAVVAVSCAVGPSGGMYTPLALLLAVAALVLAVTASLLPDRHATVSAAPHLGATIIDRTLILLWVLAVSEAVRKSDPVAAAVAVGAAATWALGRSRPAPPPGPSVLCAAALLLSGQGVLFA